MRKDRSRDGIWPGCRPVLIGFVCGSRCVDAERAEVQSRCGLAKAAAEQVEDGRRHGLGRGQR